MTTLEDAKAVALELAPTVLYSRLSLESAATLLLQDGDDRARLLKLTRYVIEIALPRGVALSEVAGYLARMRREKPSPFHTTGIQEWPAKKELTMGQTVTTKTRWECDGPGCGMAEEFDGDLPAAAQEDWRRLKTVKPDAPGLYETETGQDWLLCRPCYRLSTDRLEMTSDKAFRELVELRDFVASVRDGADLHPWIWQGDGRDDLPTIGNEAKIQITGAQLRELVARAEDMEKSEPRCG